MKEKTIWIAGMLAGLRLLLAASPVLAQDQAAALGDLAVQANPGVAALERRIEALRQQVTQAGAWLDPMVSVEYSGMPAASMAPGDRPVSDPSMGGLQVHLEETFLFPGKTALRRATAEGELRQEQELLAERKVQLRAMVARAYYGLALARQLREVTERHIGVLDGLIAVVRARYEVGKGGGQQDLLRLGVLRAQLADGLGDFDREDRALTAAINSALDRRIDVPVATPGRLAPSPPPLDEETLVSLATAQRPLLRWYAAQARTQHTAARQAAREGHPDITTRGSYHLRPSAGIDPGNDAAGAGLSAPLPFSHRSRRGAARREHEERPAALEAEGRAELSRTRRELSRLLATRNRSAQQADRHLRPLLPDAPPTRHATSAAY